MNKLLALINRKEVMEGKRISLLILLGTRHFIYNIVFTLD